MSRPITIRPVLPPPVYEGDAGEFTEGEIVRYHNPSPKEMGWWERTYLPEVFRGLWITGSNFLSRLWTWIRWTPYFLTGRKDTEAALRLRAKAATVQFYPEYERPDISPRNRGKHILTKRPSGDPQCVACYMCATACPAWCIHIEAGEHPDPAIEKYPVRFDIEIDKCIFCGFCEEACPVDAIRLTTDYHTTDYYRERMIYDRDFLLNWNPTVVTEEHLFPGGFPRKGE